MPWNCLNKRRFEGTHTTGDGGKFFFGFQLPVTGKCQQMAQTGHSPDFDECPLSTTKRNFKSSN